MCASRTRVSASAPPAARDSYLNMVSILSAAAVTGADAIHPGYGFLSENAAFAEMVEDHGLTFIGPSADHIRMMGDKITARTAMAGPWGAAGPRLARRAARSRFRTRNCRADRLPGAHQGDRRWWRPRHEGGARRLRTGRSLARRPHRSPRGLWQRRSLSGKIPRQATPHRIAGDGRQSRQRRAFRRTRLQPAAPPPESARRSRLARAHRQGARLHRRHRHRGAAETRPTAMPARSNSSTRTASSPSSK